MAEIIEKQIENLNTKLCELYPADTEKCIKNTNKSRLRIIFYILFIIFGIYILKMGHDIITNIFSNIVKGFNGFIGLSIIAYGFVSLINI